MPVSADGYVSFRGTQRRVFGELADAAPVVVVDVDEYASGVLRLPPSFLRQRRLTLLVRLPDFARAPKKLPRAVEVSLQEWQDAFRIGLLVHPLGEPTRIEKISGPDLTADVEADFLRRARAVELEALLEFGKAIWRPTAFHYRLITGEHAEAYVKLGDAIRQPRDATALASWLHRYLDAGVGMIFDTGTLTPIAQALQLQAARARVEIGPAGMLDDYPRSVPDVSTTIDRVAGRHRRVAIVVSVSSSGSLLERVEAALAFKGRSIEAETTILVSKTGPSAGHVDAWTPLPNQDFLVPPGSDGEAGCELCRQPGKATLVPINPFTFDAILPTQFELVVPDIKDPTDNRGLWEAAQRNTALSVERAAQPELRRYRSDKVPMGIKLEAAKLLEDNEFRAEVRAKLEGLASKEGLSRGADLVLAPEHEVKHEGFDSFWEATRPYLAPDVSAVTPFPNDQEFSSELGERIRAAKSILVFQLGTVSGATIQRALVGIQLARGDNDDFVLQAVVVHARPATRRELDTIRNSYGHQGKQPHMRFVWSSVLPDRSPLREENVQLRTVKNPEDLSEDTKSFWTIRRELCGGRYLGAEAPLVLWGSTRESKLTPNAIYGRALDAVTTYVAVGSAMSAALGDREQKTPGLRVFEVAAIARSYYDPLILGCMFRWMRPHEVFWGWTAAEAKATALHTLDRAEGLGQQILVPELLLASAQGKLTREAAEVTINVAHNMQREGPASADLAGALELGLRLAGDPKRLPATEEIYDPK